MFKTDGSCNGGATPSFNSVPDLLGRLTYPHDGMELGGRGLLRQLSIKTGGTALPSAAQSADALGWGLALHARLPMRWLSDAFGPYELLAMAHDGDGIGRYFGGNTSGQDALSDIGLAATTRVALDAIPTHGAVAAYRRFRTTQLRSSFSSAYAYQDYPIVRATIRARFTGRRVAEPRHAAVIVNLIWSPFPAVRDGAFGAGWLDLALEYL